jgi:hypothetical protein
VTAPDFSGLDMAALWQDVKAAGSIGLGRRGVHWSRFAVVTNKDWIRHSIGGVRRGRAGAGEDVGGRLAIMLASCNRYWLSE